MKNNMRELRFKRGLTLADLWLRTRIHQPKLSQIERGIFEPTSDEISRISRVLGVSKDEVFPRK